MQSKELMFKRSSILFAVIIILKIFLLCSFSSDYQNELFIPFVTHFLKNLGNPWDYFHQYGLGVEFPYSPFMLYIFSLFYFPVHYFGMKGIIIQNFFFKLPILLADVSIFYLLSRMFFDKKKILFYYFTAPIILYSSYMHSQLDLIPTALLFFSVYLLVNNKIVSSSILAGLAISTKFHVIAAWPLLLVYVFRKHKLIDVIKFILIPPAIFLFLVFPHFGKGYYYLVLNNPKQVLVYDTFAMIGNVKVYLPFLLVVLLYARFSVFRKVNNDLLYAFLALTFSSFVAFITPAPGWYVWLFPFLSILFIKFSREKFQIILLYITLNVMYLIYMVFFFPPEFIDLIFVDTPLQFKIETTKLHNLSFTMLEATLIASMYTFYKFGIKSNFVYKKRDSTVIGIAGDSGAGKTTLLSDLKSLLGKKVSELEGDADHKWARNDENWEHFTHLNPKANFLYRQYEDLVNLKFGKKIFRPNYDHSIGKFTNLQKIKAGDYIILSGLHTFYLPKMRKVIDFKIYLDTDEVLRKYWKITRDTRKRGYFKEAIIQQIDRRKTDSQKYIYPQKGFADMIVAYFIDGDYKMKNIGTPPKIKLKIIIDSSVHIEEIISRLEKKMKVSWDYSEDLKTQILVLDGWVNDDFLENISKKMIMNLEELLGEKPAWMEGYRGVVQLMVLLILSEKMKMIQTGDSSEI